MELKYEEVLNEAYIN